MYPFFQRAPAQNCSGRVEVKGGVAQTLRSSESNWGKKTQDATSKSGRHLWIYSKRNSECARLQGAGKLHRLIGTGGGTEGRCQTDPEERFYFYFFSPATYRATAPSSLGRLLHLTAEANATDGSTLFQGSEIVPVAFRGPGPMLLLAWSWSAVDLLIHRVPLPGGLP